MMISKILLKQILKSNRFFGKRIKPRKTPPPKIKKWIKKNNDAIIEKIVVCRAPVNKIVKKLLNIITIGKFDKSLKGLHYDDIFHLYIYITINGETWRIEKNEVVSLKKTNQMESEDCKDIKLRNKQIKLGEFMKKGEDYHKDFWSYDAKNNNCQDFVISLLLGNKLINKNNKTYRFIKQDAVQIFNSNPKFLERLGQNVTDLAGLLAMLRDPF